LHLFGHFSLLRIRQRVLGRHFGKFDAPESGRRLGEFHLDVTIRRFEIALESDLRDDFALGFLVGEKKQLSRSDRGSEAQHSAAFKYEDRGGFFGKEFAVAACFAGSRAGNNDLHFVSDGI
jgi:hypothetical protein